MNNEEKYKYAYTLTSVASTGLCFVEDSLSSLMSNTTDGSRLRSFYILLSYNFELILKSRVVMVKSFSDKKAINAELIKLGHNLEEIGKSLSVDLKELEINEIIKKDGKYKITIDDKEIYIEDFTKIRYDFLDNIMHQVDNKEHLRMKEDLEILFSVLRKTKSKNEETKNTLK